MVKTVDYYLSLNSPWAYLGSRTFGEILKRHGAQVRVKPVILGEVFPRTGGLPLAKRAPERQAYRLVELKRWAAFRDMPLNLHPQFFPAPEVLAAGCVLALGESGGDALTVTSAILRAVWAEERNIADEATLAEILRENGQDPDSLFAKARAPKMAETYKALSEEAIARGVFGAPSYIYKDKLFWGQDRLDFLDRALAK
jgi:carboxymethylenebutenolidase